MPCQFTHTSHANRLCTRAIREPGRTRLVETGSAARGSRKAHSASWARFPLEHDNSLFNVLHSKCKLHITLVAMKPCTTALTNRLNAHGAIRKTGRTRLIKTRGAAHWSRNTLEWHVPLPEPGSHSNTTTNSLFNVLHSPCNEACRHDFSTRTQRVQLK